MLPRLTPLAADRTKQMTVLHATAAVKPVVHMFRVVLHEITALWTDGILVSVELKHVPDKRYLLKLNRCTHLVRFILTLIFCRLTSLLFSQIHSQLPSVRLRVSLLVYLVTSLATVHHTGIIVHQYARLTVRVYIMPVSYTHLTLPTSDLV